MKTNMTEQSQTMLNFNRELTIKELDKREMDEQFKDWERDWRKTLPTMKDYREAFDVREIEDVYGYILDDVSDKIKQELAYHDHILKQKAKCKDSQDWFYSWLLEESDVILKELRRQQRSWQIRRDILLGKADDKQFDLESIKKIPLENIMPSSPQSKLGNRWKYSCVLPNHPNDKTPSFVYYRDQNKYHCYGCGGYGTSVDLYMNLYSCDFVTACKALNSLTR